MRKASRRAPESSKKSNRKKMVLQQSAFASLGQPTGSNIKPPVEVLRLQACGDRTMCFDMDTYTSLGNFSTNSFGRRSLPDSFPRRHLRKHMKTPVGQIRPAYFQLAKNDNRQGGGRTSTCRDVVPTAGIPHYQKVYGG